MKILAVLPGHGLSGISCNFLAQVLESLWLIRQEVLTVGTVHISKLLLMQFSNISVVVTALLYDLCYVNQKTNPLVCKPKQPTVLHSLRILKIFGM